MARGEVARGEAAPRGWVDAKPLLGRKPLLEGADLGEAYWW